MSFPWAVKANTRTYRKRDKARLAAWRPRRKSLRWFVFLALSGATSVLDTPVARAEPPPPTELPIAAAQFVAPGSGSAVLPPPVGNAMTITQHSQKVILNWQRFNIGRDASVEFKQPDASSSALNRILQGSPSQIFGSLKANGQIYLLNQNGIIFGNGAVVDTHTLVASTINITDDVFANIGLTNAINQAQGKERAAFVGAGTGTGFIQIEAGAVLKSAVGGRIMIFAPVVENQGEINTPGGQAILAASKDKVYLANSDDENLRGLLVEVETGGDVENLGKIIAERGNVSIIGLVVNQNGIVRATTSVNLNGSIRLVARDTTQFVTIRTGSKVVNIPVASKTGTLTLGAGSLTEVAPDDLALTAADAQAQPLSRIELMGDQVTLESGAQVVAPGGNVSIIATKSPQAPGPSNDSATNNDSKFVMAPGSRIDVSGLASAVLPMERNVIAVELRGSQLADSPLQRNGPLRGETVYVDVRQGTPLANVKADIEKIERPLAERLSTGGKVSILSDDKVVTAESATIDVSGGAIRYQDGFVKTTQLISQGKAYDIGDADPNRPYDGISGVHKVVHRKWGVTEVFGAQGSARFERGYVEGKDAGTVEINARNDKPDNLVLQGTLRGETTAGRNQRLPPTSLPVDGAAYTRRYDEVPLGGELILGAASNSGLENFTLGSLTDLGAVGVSRLRVYANGEITTPGNANLILAPGGELSLTASRVDVKGDIAAHGGRVRINAGLEAELGADAQIDVSGQWVNDSVVLNPGAAPQDPVFINGGSVTMEAMGNVTLERASVINADGGAQLQRNGKLKFGDGGAISIASKPLPGADANKPALLRLDGELHAYSFNKGGSLSLTGAGFRIGGAAGDTPENTVYLPPAFFQSGGFRAYNLKATHTGITLAQNTDIRLRALNRVLNPSFNLLPTGTELGRLGGLGFLPDYQQQPVSLDFSLARAENVNVDTVRVELESGSSIHANPGASIALTSDTQLIVDGTIAAPAGNIRLTLTAPADPDSNEKGFDNSQAIWLGPNGQLLAQADFQPIPDGTGRGLRTGTVRDGGTVTIAAERGYFVASPGSKIDVSGTTQVLDVPLGPSVTPTEVNGAAGTIDLLAAEGMVLNGGLRGVPGSGAGAAGGALNVALDPTNRIKQQLPFGLPVYLTGPRDIVLTTTESAESVAPAIGKEVPDKLNGIVRLNPERITAGGFDRLKLRVRSADAFDKTAARIVLEGDVQLALARHLVLEAPVLASHGGHAKLAAAYVQLGASEGFINDTAVNPSGDGSLLVQAQHVDLLGTTLLRGFGPDGGGTDTAPVRIESDGDIRLIGGNEIQNRADGIFAMGRLNSAADVTLRADQVYIATATDFTVSVSGDNGRITVQPGGASTAPLSAGSKLTLAAADIEQNGTLRAPFGRIEFNASRTLALGAGSVTAVSGSGQLAPFGRTEFGQDWLYPLGNFQGVYNAPPEKRVALKAPEVTLAPGSVVDVTGGGDLLAREQIPGPGGSSDILNNTLSNGTPNNAFAIVPAQTNPFGSYDPFLSKDSPAKPGDTIYMAGGGPLPAGQYAVLPAGYALLPGAYLVTPLAKTAAPVPGTVVQQHDGSAVVAGQRGIAGTGIRDSLWSAFQIENGAQVRNRAEYLESRADGFFAAGGRQNRDAGQLVIDAGTALTLGGTLATSTAAGRGSEVDILADRLAVVAQRSGTSGRVELLAAELNNLNADSLLLGASRQRQGRDEAFDVRATTVTVESGATVTAPEVMLAAQEHVAVADGATITAADGNRVIAPETIQLTGDSALARISSAEQVRVQRTSSAGTKGTLDVAAGAVLDASRSITLDASQDTVVDGDLRTHSGSLSLAAARVSLGETQGVVTGGGLMLSNDRLAKLDASNLTLNSRGTIDLYGQVSLENLNQVALDAAGLAGYSNANQNVSIKADAISLSNRSGRPYTPGSAGAPNGSGVLNIAAREVTLGEGNFAVRGFSNTIVSASEQIVARPETDTPVNLHVAGDLTLSASRVAASHGADVRIDTQDATGAMAGNMMLTTPAAPATFAPVTELGAKLELAASAIDHSTRIELPSGIATLQATKGDVNIAPTASIDVSGRDLRFGEITVGSPGGRVTLTADQGNVRIQGDALTGAGARIDVSGAPSGGDAGMVSIFAPKGEVELHRDAKLIGQAHHGGRTGSFALDTRTLANTNNFSALIAALNGEQAGFTDSLQLRQRSGDVSIDTNILAHDLRIAADDGKIDVHGRINASGTQAGRVALYAQKDLTLHDSSSIDAHATGADEKGGSVTLASTDGRLDLQAGADINVAGTDETGKPANTGTVHLRAAREGTNDSDVAISPIIPANIKGAERVDIEAFKIYKPASTDGSIDSLIDPIKSETNAFMAGAGQIKNRLGVNSDVRFHLLPGVEIQSTGDLALNADWDLFGAGWRYGGEAGVLSLRASGDLNLKGTLSDGVAFVPPVPGDASFTARDVVQAGPSWSYRLAGGADLASADPLAVRSKADLTDAQGNIKGNVMLAAGVKVRTGTGDIEIAAGKDLQLTDSSSAIYTVGENRGVGTLPSAGGGARSAATIKELFLKGDFLHNGGDVRITAGGDVRGADSHQFISEWMSRVGGTVDAFDEDIALPVAWAVNIAEFRQNIGALGGGDVTLTAGGGIDNLSVVIPTTGQPVGVPGTAPSIAGGGDLRIETGGDVRGGVFYLAKGQAEIAAGGSVTKAAADGSGYPILALGDGQYSVRARKNLTIESVVNPTVLAANPKPYYPDIIESPPLGSFFFTYAENSAVRLEAIAGDTVLRGDTGALGRASKILKTSEPSVLGYYPGTLSARSLQGDIIVGGRGFTLLPAPRGDLELLARGNITSTAGTTVQMSDADPQLLPSVVKPSPDAGAFRVEVAAALAKDAATPAHLGDTQPARIVAQTGTLGSLPDSLNTLSFDLPKQARLYAGEDVRNLTLNIQHVDAGDISVVEAGKSILFPTERDGAGRVNSNADQKFVIAGPGQFYVIAGKDVDLGASSGIQSIGNQKNPALPDGGASVTVMAGQAQAPTYDVFIKRYLVNEDVYHERLAQYMNGLASHETDATKAKAFREKPLDSFRTALPLTQQRKFILEVLFNELRESGVAAAASKDYARGFTAIKKLFPAESYPGDVKSFLSQITTADGGDINIVAPGGLVNAGVASTAALGAKKADQLGIVVARDGDINALVHGDFLVNQSRVFALDGGDILIWSSTGGIDAGKGAKTALSIPPPKTTTDAEGNTIIEFPPAISGSGIRNAVSTPGKKPGDTFLIAPVGVINAGDAGIGSAGNLTIAATAVIGADNIQVGGASVGVPTDTGGLSAGLAGVGDIAATASKMAEDVTRGLTEQKEGEQGYLSVEVTGFGEGEEGGGVVNLRRRKPSNNP